jgi:hypothetical protein
MPFRQPNKRSQTMRRAILEASRCQS